MTEYPNTPFADGDEFTADLAYKAFYCPVFDGQTQYLGHRDFIQDSELSATGIKLQVDTVINGLKCTVATGLNVNYTSGLVMLPTGTLLTKASGAVVVPDNATSYIYVNQAGNVVAGVTRSVARVTLAQAVAVGGVITSLTDYRHPSILHIRQPSYVLRSFGGQSTIAKTCVQGETLRGTIECSTFTVPAGVSVTVDKYCKVIASDKVDIYGTITVNPQAPGAPFTNYSIPTSVGLQGYQPGVGLGNDGSIYTYTQQRYGSGGGQGYIRGRPGLGTASWGVLRNGGMGGGAFIVEAAGDITVYTSATITAKGGDGTTPSSTDDAGTTYQCLASGSGGGSGGLVELVSAGTTTLQAGSTIDVRGGNGSAGYIYMPGYATPAAAAGGLGGSGGYLVTIGANGVNTTGFTFLNAGGGWGTHASLNSGVVAQSSSQITYSGSLTAVVYIGGIGGGFAGTGQSTSVVGNVVNSVPAGSGVQYVSTNLPG